MSGEAVARELLAKADAVCFDVDSTVCIDEGIDEFAAFLGKKEAVAALTASAMGGGVTFQEALTARLELMQPTKKHLDDFLAANPPKLSPGVADFITALKGKGKHVYLVSGGFTQMIHPLADILGVDRACVFANTILFSDSGDYAGFDEKAFTSRSGGKPACLTHLKTTHSYTTLAMIGDGATDLEAKQPGAADVFIGYGGVQGMSVVTPGVGGGAPGMSYAPPPPTGPPTQAPPAPPGLPAPPGISPAPGQAAPAPQAQPAHPMPPQGMTGLPPPGGLPPHAGAAGLPGLPGMPPPGMPALPGMQGGLPPPAGMHGGMPMMPMGMPGMQPFRHHHHHHHHAYPPMGVPPMSMPPGYPPSVAAPVVPVSQAVPSRQRTVPAPTTALPPPSSVARMVEVELGPDLPTPPEISSGLGPIGLMEKVTVTQDAGTKNYHCQVVYSSPRAAARVSKKGTVGIAGRQCTATASTQPISCTSYDRPSLSLWVGLGPHTNVTQDDVGREFVKLGAGHVQKVEMAQEDPLNNYAVVTFCSVDTAMRAHKAEEVKIGEVDVSVDWFHPSESMGTASATTPTSLPCPEELRKLVFRFDVDSLAMDDEIGEAVAEHALGKVERVAMNMTATEKIAYIVMDSLDSAKRCREAFENGTFFFDTAPGLTVEWALLQRPEGDKPDDDADADVVVADGVSLKLLLVFDTPETVRELGSQKIMSSLEAITPNSVRELSCKGNAVCARFRQASFALKAQAVLQEHTELKPASIAFIKKWQFEGTDDTKCVAGDSEEHEPVVLPDRLFGCVPPELAPPKTTKAPSDAGLTRVIDAVAESFAQTGKPTIDSELCLRVPHAGYFKHRVEWAKQGLSKKSVSALQKLRAAASTAPRFTPRTSHHYEYTKPGEIPFDKRMNILILDETNLTFAMSLTRVLNNGERVVVTTKPKKEVLLQEYEGAAERVQKLYDSGVKIGYGFNVTKGSEYEELPTPEDKFDAIIVNFPVATEGGEDCDDTEENQRYVRKILKHCPTVLASRGCVYITHVDGEGYRDWEITKSALRADTGLRLINRFMFRRCEYPGYTPVFASFDPAGKFKDATCYVFGKKKKFDAFDPQEERGVEFERLKDQRRQRRESTDSSNDESDEKEKRRRKKDKRRRDDDEPAVAQIEDRPPDSRGEGRSRRDERRRGSSYDDRRDRRGDRGDRRDPRDRRRDRR